MHEIIRASRAAVFDNRELKLTPEEVKTRTGCTHVLNGWVFNDDFDLCGWTIIDHTVLSADEYRDFGFACGDTGAPVMSTVRTMGHFLSGVPILKDGNRLCRELTPDVKRPAERTAVGWLKDGRVLLWCSREIMTREQLQERLLSLGCVDALMFDGGGSTQGDFSGRELRSSRIVATLILLWEDNREENKMEERKRVCLDAGHGASNKANASPDRSYYEHEFALDMAKRIKAVLEAVGVAVVETRPDGGDVSLGERCRIANAAAVDLFVSLHSNATGKASAGADGWGSARGWMCYVYGLSGERYKAAQAILGAVEGVCPAIRKTPVVANAGLYVLANTKAPAVLIEHGFHTNREDVALMKDAAYREKLAAAEAAGILDYLGISVPVKTEAEEAVEWITESGIMKGDVNGDLMLEKAMTRKEFAVMLHRFMKIT